MLAMLIFIIALLIMTVFTYIWILSNDYAIPKQRLPGIKKALAIFPHPDDETLTCSGLLHDLARQGTETHLAILTLGERGVEGAVYTPDLKKTRKQEAAGSAAALRSRLHIYDLGDGELDKKYRQVRELVFGIINDIKPDLLITYDQSGLYGHPDHIAVSQAMTEYSQQHSQIRLWYVSRPQKVYDRMKLPVHMARDKGFLKKRTQASHRISITIWGIIAKIKSMYAHQSQHFAFKKSRTWLPLWFWVAAQTDEYYYQVESQI